MLITYDIITKFSEKSEGLSVCQKQKSGINVNNRLKSF